MNFLEYNKDEKLSFNYKKPCGLWLIVVALIIFAATVIGGKQIINMSVFSFGYIAAFLSINTNKKVLNKFSDGPSSKFQNKMSLYAVIFLFILMFLLGGPFFATENWRLIWLGALMATALFPLLLCAWKIDDLFGYTLRRQCWCRLYFSRYPTDSNCLY